MNFKEALLLISIAVYSIFISCTTNSFKCKNELFFVNNVEVTISKPKQWTNKTIVVFVHGSGSLDKNSTFNFTNNTDCHFKYLKGKKIQLFDELSNGFCKQGIATLRYDKLSFREKGYYTKGSASPFDFLIDLKKILDWISQNKTLKEYKIILLGHSQGSAIISNIAISNEYKISGLISIGGLGTSAETHFINQIKTKYIDCENDSLKAYVYSQQLKRIFKSFQTAYLKGDSTNVLLEMVDSTENFINKSWEDLGKKYFWREQLRLLNSSRENYSNLTLPVLFIHGKNDVNIPFESGLFSIETLNKVTNTFIQYEGTDHFLRQSPEYELNKNVVDDIVQWVNQITT